MCGGSPFFISRQERYQGALETVSAIKGVPLDEKYYSDNVAIVPITEYTTV